MAYSLCKIYGSMHSARVIYYAMYTQRVFRKGLFITQYIRSEHSERRRGRFIAPASSTKTIGCNLQNITDCNANNGKQNMRKTMLRNYLYDNALRKTTFLCCKSMVFGVQKPYFYIAKTPFLHCKKGELHYSLWLFCCCFRHSSSRIRISFLAVSI